LIQKVSARMFYIGDKVNRHPFW